MAYTSIIPVRRLDRAVDYVRDKAKTTSGPKSLQDAVDLCPQPRKDGVGLFRNGPQLCMRNRLRGYAGIRYSIGSKQTACRDTTLFKASLRAK